MNPEKKQTARQATGCKNNFFSFFDKRPGEMDNSFVCNLVYKRKNEYGFPLFNGKK
jgi:hypothetical protein